MSASLWIGIGLIFAASLVPIFCTPVMPLIDFYNHIARYYVMSHVAHDPILAQNYAASWHLLPNLGLDVIGSLLMLVAPPYAVARALVVLIMLTQYAGVIALNAALWRRPSLLVAALAAMLLYSYILVWGFSNFLFGMGLSFLAAAWWIWKRDNLRVCLPVSILLSILIFFVHGFAFAIYGALVGSLELGRWVNQPVRRLADLFRTAGLLIVQAIAPAILFLCTATAGGGVTDAFDSAHRPALGPRLAWELQHRIQTVVRVAEGPSFGFDLIVLSLTIAALGLLVYRRQVRLPKASWVALGVFAVLAIIVPPAMFGVAYLSDRIPLAFSMLLVASVVPDWSSEDWKRWASFGFLSLLAVRLVAVGIDWSHYRSDFAAYRSITKTIPPGALVRTVIVSGANPRDGFMPRCQMYSPLTVIDRRAASPLFADATQQPLRLIGKLGQIGPSAPPMPKINGVDLDYAYEEARIADLAAGGKFNYMLICGRQRLHKPLPQNMRFVDAGGPLELYRIASPQGGPSPPP